MPRAFVALLLTAFVLGPCSVRAQQTRPVRVFPGAKGPIRNVALSRDGKLVAAGVFADEVRIWKVSTGKLAHLLVGGAGPSIAAAFAPDGKSIVTTSGARGDLFVWDLPSGRKRLTLSRDPQTFVHHVAFSPDGKWIAGIGGEVRIWNAASGKLVYSTPTRLGGCTVVFSPDSKRLVWSDHSGAVALIDVVAVKQVRAWRPGNVAAGLAFSPDGVSLYCGCSDGWIREFASGRSLRSWQTGKGVARTLSISPDGCSLAVSTSQGVVQVWELATLKQRRAFAADTGFAWSVAFAPDGKSVVTAGDEAIVRLWDVTGGWTDAAVKKPLTEGQLETLWNDLGGEADVAFTAVWALAAHGKQSVALLAKKLRSLTATPAKQIARLIRMLDADDFAEREKASKALARGGAAVRQALEAAMRNPASLEQKRRMSRLLVELRDARLSEQEIRRARMTEILRKIDSAEARKLLHQLSN